MSRSLDSACRQEPVRFRRIGRHVGQTMQSCLSFVRPQVKRNDRQPHNVVLAACAGPHEAGPFRYTTRCSVGSSEALVAVIHGCECAPEANQSSELQLFHRGNRVAWLWLPELHCPVVQSSYCAAKSPSKEPVIQIAYNYSMFERSPASSKILFVSSKMTWVFGCFCP